MLRVACAMPRASACGSSWLSVESKRVALATIATPSRADAPRRRPAAAVRHATAAEAPATHWAGRQKARAALASATRLMSESDRASFAAYDVEFVVEISRCSGPAGGPEGRGRRAPGGAWSQLSEEARDELTRPLRVESGRTSSPGEGPPQWQPDHRDLRQRGRATPSRAWRGAGGGGGRARDDRDCLLYTSPSPRD